MSGAPPGTCPAFGPEHARRYDARWARSAPIRDALHLLAQSILGELPADARVLCVGAGTGAEVLALGAAFPGWRFTAVEPSAAMLEVCREKVTAAGLAARCALHEGTLDTLPPSEPFHAATSILVSQFLLDPAARRAYFAEIARRLAPGGTLITADLASDLDPQAYDAMIDAWLRMHGDDVVAGRVSCAAAWGKAVAVSTPREIEELIAQAGFDGAVRFYQALFIHAWWARRQ